MPSTGDEPLQWDVLSSPLVTEEASPAPVELYHPPAMDSPDPTALDGGEDMPGRRFRFVLRFAMTLVALSLSIIALTGHNPIWTIALTASVAALVGWLIVLAGRRPIWRKPRIAVDREGFTVTDVTGATRRVAWSDVGEVYLTSVSELDVEELHLRWTSTRGSTDVTANLGNSLDIIEVRSAIMSHIPAGPELHVGPQRSQGYG